MLKYAENHYALVALDMDGTLLNSEHETTAYTRDIIHQAACAGKIAALSTGRCLSELKEHMEILPDIRYIICENGACVYDTEEKSEIRHVSFSRDEIEFVLNAAKDFDATRQCFIDNQSILECRDEEDLKRHKIYDFVGVFRKGSMFVDDVRDYYYGHEGSVEKINVYFSNDDDRRSFVRKLEGHGLLAADSIGIGIEISPADATKARGLEALCEHLQLSLDESIAVGDGGNDVDIMKTAGLSVAMGNAIDEILEIADVVTEDCDHDGAAKAIARYMMGWEV